MLTHLSMHLPVYHLGLEDWSIHRACKRSPPRIILVSPPPFISALNSVLGNTLCVTVQSIPLCSAPSGQLTRSRLCRITAGVASVRCVPEYEVSSNLVVSSHRALARRLIGLNWVL